MNCFSHDKDHWRTEPRWTLEPFCFCMNANNNTYYCLRTINSTHNFLYCEFVTGLVTFYNLRIGAPWFTLSVTFAYINRKHQLKRCILDPFETQNREKYLTPEEKSFLHDQLEELKRCKGRSCSEGANQTPTSVNARGNGWKTNGRSHSMNNPFRDTSVVGQVSPISAAAAAAVAMGIY